MLITPSALPVAEMTTDSMVRMDLEGKVLQGGKPSSEWRFHRDIMMNRSDVGAIVHAHPTYCTAFAMCRREIPAVHYMIAAAGGPTIRCGTYATFGTAELSEAALLALEGRTYAQLKAAAQQRGHGIRMIGRVEAKGEALTGFEVGERVGGPHTMGLERPRLEV